MKKNSISRRQLLGAGAALPLGALAARAGAAEQCGATPAQTSGPFYPLYDQVDKDVDLTRLTGHGRPAEGTVIRVSGRVLDEQCQPVANALVDLWQADNFGRYRHPADPNPARMDPNFQGWGQAATDAEGRYGFRTIKPSSYPLAFLADGAPDLNAGYRAPHIHFRISKRGYTELLTQMYFEGEALNRTDIVLLKVPEAERPRVVIAPSAATDPPLYVFDLVLKPA